MSSRSPTPRCDEHARLPIVGARLEHVVVSGPFLEGALRGPDQASGLDAIGAALKKHARNKARICARSHGPCKNSQPVYAQHPRIDATRSRTTCGNPRDYSAALGRRDRPELIRSFMMLLGRNTKTLRGVMGTSLPVLGFRPMRSPF